jgi:hypothetical protein
MDEIITSRKQITHNRDRLGLEMGDESIDRIPSQQGDQD